MVTALGPVLNETHARLISACTPPPSAQVTGTPKARAKPALVSVAAAAALARIVPRFVHALAPRALLILQGWPCDRAYGVWGLVRRLAGRHWQTVMSIRET